MNPYKIIPFSMPLVAYFMSAVTILFAIPHAKLWLQKGTDFALFGAYATLTVMYLYDLVKVKEDNKKLTKEYFRSSIFSVKKRIPYGVITCVMVMAFIFNSLHYDWYYIIGIIGYILLITKNIVGALLLSIFFIIRITK